MTLNELEKILGKGRVQADKNLLPYLTFHTLTSAEYYFEAETREDWIKVGKLKASGKIPVFILGGGSNLAVLKDKIVGIVVKNMYSKLELLDETDKYSDILVSSGFPVVRLVTEAVRKGYGGLEYHLGLPGTVGGAIYMNSKWTNPLTYFGDSLLYAYIIDNDGEEKKVDRDYFKFAYDYSILHDTKEILLEAVFRLKKELPEMLKKRADSAFLYRKETQPTGSSCGCFFRNVSEEVKSELNLPSSSAGYLIDKAGLKGTQIGDFIVSDKHSNFIINKGQGNPADLLRLLTLIKEKVKEKFGVELKEEVIVI